MCLRPSTWLVAALLFASVLLATQRLAWAKRVIYFAAAMSLLLALFPVGDAFIRHLELKYPANPPVSDIDTILILGGGQDLRVSEAVDQVSFVSAEERVIEGAVLAQRFPGASIIVTGGNGSLDRRPDITEAALSARLLIDLGIDEDRIVIEDQSRSTRENAAYTRACSGLDDFGQTVLVTSAFHMPRAMKTFDKAGWSDLTPYPVDYMTSPSWKDLRFDLANNLLRLRLAMREHLGLLAESRRAPVSVSPDRCGPAE